MIIASVFCPSHIKFKCSLIQGLNLRGFRDKQASSKDMSISFECPFPFVFTRRQQKKTTVSTAEYMFSYQYSPPHGDHCCKCYLQKLTMHAQNKTLEQHGSFLVISKLMCLKIVINWPTAMIPLSLNKFSIGCALLMRQHLRLKNSLKFSS